MDKFRKNRVENLYANYTEQLFDYLFYFSPLRKVDLIHSSVKTQKGNPLLFATRCKECVNIQMNVVRGGRADIKRKTKELKPAKGSKSAKLPCSPQD